MKTTYEQRLSWTQVSDLRLPGKEVASQYGIKSILRNLLPDPEGKIIARSAGREEMK